MYLIAFAHKDSSMAYSGIREGDGIAKAAADEWLKQADAARVEALRARRAMGELQSKGTTCVEGAFVFEDANKPWTAIHQNLREYQAPVLLSASEIPSINVHARTPILSGCNAPLRLGCTTCVCYRTAQR